MHTSRQKVLILTAEIGQGHTSLASAMAETTRDDFEVDIKSLLPNSRLFSCLPALYSCLVRHAPRVWAAYYAARRSKLVRLGIGAIVRKRMLASISVIDARQYDSIVLTHSLYCHVIPLIRSSTSAFIVVAVSDLYEGPREWFSSDADRYIVPTREQVAISDHTHQRNVGVLVRRLPNCAQFVNCRDAMAAVMHQKRVDRIVIIANAKSSRYLRQLLMGVHEYFFNMHIVVICGPSKQLFRHLRKLSADRLQLLSYVEDLGRHLSAYDMALTKPGSSMVMELLESRTPFVLTDGIPGIEQGTLEHICGAVHLQPPRNVQDVLRTLRTLLTPSGRLTAPGIDWIQHLSNYLRQMPEAPIISSDLIR